jgi:Cu+-exporting ATPase
MDVLVALGSGVAYVYSVGMLLLTWMGRVNLHGLHGEFHAAVAIVVLVTLGKYLEARAKKRASSAVAGLATQASATAVRVLADGKTETVAAERVAVGDLVQVLAHQQLPVDGVLVEGHGALDMSVVTGESVPVEVQGQWSGVSGQWSEGAERPIDAPAAGGRSLSLKVVNAPAVAAPPPPPPPPPSGPVLPGGATLSDGRIVIRATSTAATSTVARILELVNNAQASKTQIQALADRVAGVFVPIVLVLALANFGMWLMLGAGWEKALLTTIATIIIACPCAMGLATPTAITVAMGRAAKLGILFTQASALESGRRIGTVVFDKTGTLTTGKLHLAEAVGVILEETPAQATHPQLTPAGQRALAIAASLEQYSEHPIAKAIGESGRRFELPVSKPERFSSMPGGGLSGWIGGREYVLGSVAFIEHMGVRMEAVAADIERLRNDGKTLVALAERTGGELRLMGLFALQDTLRAEAREAVKVLRDKGIQVGVFSGDTELAVRAAVHNMPVDFLKSGIKPAEKASAVERLKLALVGDGTQRFPAGVAFVGDGVNDGPALAAADLGIAMASGADIAKGAGDVLLMSNHLSAVPAVFELSRRTLRVIKQNLFWAFAYNVAAIPLAMAGILPPAFAAAAMMFSSLSVVINALRLYRVPLK